MKARRLSLLTSTIKFPEKSYPWPTQGLRRASVNSFGYGGSNSHIVLDDAYNYMRLRSLDGKHCTVPSSPSVPSQQRLSSIDNRALIPEVESPKLCVWSAKDKDGIGRIVKSYQDDQYAGILVESIKDKAFLANLAYTLDSRRNHFQWRSFALLNSPSDFEDFKSRVSTPTKIGADTPRFGFVFSGQGAQWFAMGRELIRYACYEAELNAAGRYLKSLGSAWSVMGK